LHGVSRIAKEKKKKEKKEKRSKKPLETMGRKKVEVCSFWHVTLCFGPRLGQRLKVSLTS